MFTFVHQHQFYPGHLEVSVSVPLRRVNEWELVFIGRCHELRVTASWTLLNSYFWGLQCNEVFTQMFSHICKLVNLIFVHTVGQRGERPFRTHKLAHYYCLQEQISSASIKFTFCKIWEFICEYLACSVLKCHKFSFLTESTEQPTCSVDKMPLLDSQSC